MTDLFAPFIKTEWLDRILEVIARHPQHVFQMLTKRPTRIRDYFDNRAAEVLPNLWLGTSVEQRRHLNRLDSLYRTPAALRFLSAEPLLEDLGAFDISRLDWVIVGAESDRWRRARPMTLDWVRGIPDQCTAHRVPLFFKQDARPGGEKLPLPELDGHRWRQLPIA
jgi:protein gp37